MITFDRSTSPNTPIPPKTMKMVKAIIYQHVGDTADGIVIFAPSLMCDESLAFKFRGTSDLEDEINAEVRVMWKDL